MAEIKSLYDAIIKTQVKENQCTNFLVWLLEKLPSKVILEICKIADLSVNQVGTNINIEVQTLFKKSCPDALIEFSEGKYLIIETKLYPNSFNKEQFLNHFNGGKDEFGEQNVWLVFLSGDECISSELNEFKKKHYGRIGFISWKSLLQFLKDNTNFLGEKFEIITKEFIFFANHYKLGRLISMNNEEIKKFLEVYPIVATQEEAVEEKLSGIIDLLKDRIIIECEELVEENTNDIQKELPCLYRAFNIKGWHLKESSYIFINILSKKIGILLTGYQDKKEKEKCLPMWSKYYKNRYKDNPDLYAYTWVDKGDDEYAIKGGYFKLAKGTSGKIFNPTQISEFTDSFYWGYVYDLEIEKIQIYNETIPKDFKKLLETFLENGLCHTSPNSG